jgi:hypothetical protein
MRKLILLGVLTTVLLGASASGASAATWSGTCHFSGKVIMLDSPLTFRLEHHDFKIPGAGRCEGTLNGAPYSGPMTYLMDGRMNTPLSCAAGVSNDVPGAITFGDDPRAVDAPKVELVVSHIHFPSEALTTVTGAYNGHGWAHLHFPGNESTLVACAGPGVSEIDYEVDMNTITPLYG